VTHVITSSLQNYWFQLPTHEGGQRAGREGGGVGVTKLPVCTVAILRAVSDRRHENSYWIKVAQDIVRTRIGT
jgi:hypothetical protein